MRTVMIRLNAPGRIRRIHMERIQMRTYLLDRRKILDHPRAGLEDAAFGCERGPRVSIVVDGDLLV